MVSIIDIIALGGLIWYFVWTITLFKQQRRHTEILEQISVQLTYIKKD